MANKRGNGRGLLWAGLAAGAYAYFKKPENRQKATEAFNNAKTKVNSYMESQNLENGGEKQTEAKKDSTEMRENKMVSEGGLTGAQYYNDKKRDEHDEDVKLSSNDFSEEKSENTETIAPENRLNTDKL